MFAYPVSNRPAPRNTATLLAVALAEKQALRKTTLKPIFLTKYG